MSAQLHPAWFGHEPGTTPSGTILCDVLDTFADKLDSLGDFMIAAGGSDAELDGPTLGLKTTSERQPRPTMAMMRAGLLDTRWTPVEAAEFQR